jgi:hypothetical protein
MRAVLAVRGTLAPACLRAELPSDKLYESKKLFKASYPAVSPMLSVRFLQTPLQADYTGT